MIICSVCGQENDDLRTLCSSCRSYIQGRVDALDLFSTIWGLIEAPAVTFRRIVLAKHKNYALILSGLAGITMVFYVAWYKNAVDKLQTLLPVVGAALLAGPLVGMLFVFGLSLLVRILAKALGGEASLRNLFAAFGYGMIPLVFALVFLVPIEIAVFGSDFFGTNPPPMTIRPIEYSVLLTLKALSGIWMIYLLVHGTMAANAFPRNRFLLVGLIVTSLLTVIGSIVHFVKI